MKTYSNKNHVVIAINNYTDAVIARKFLEYVLMVEEDVTYDNLVGKFATLNESKYSIYRIANLRSCIRQIQDFETTAEDGTKISVMMNPESYNGYVQRYIRSMTNLIATI